MRGLGKVQEEAIQKTMEKLFFFIEKNQPVAYKIILNNSHIRRNKIRLYLNELIHEERVIEIKKKYYTFPIPEQISQNEILRDYFLKILKINKKKNYQILSILQKIEKIREQHPFKVLLVERKIKRNDKEQNKIINEYFQKLQELNNFENKSLSEQIKIFSKVMHDSEDMLILLREFSLKFQLLPRIEYPRYKDKYENKLGIHPEFILENTVDLKKMLICYEKGYNGNHKNPLGIHPKFLKRDKTINYDYIEDVYQTKLSIGICPGCGEYIADPLNYILDKILNNKGKKIPKKTYDNIVKQAPTPIFQATIRDGNLDLIPISKSMHSNH